MTHQVTPRQDGTFGIRNLASNAVYGSFATFAEALEALCESALADRAALADPSQY